MRESSIVKCPICGRTNDFNTDPFGPFCTARCKMVDLGRWMNEEYRISDPLRADHFAEYENMEGRDLDDPTREP